MWSDHFYAPLNQFAVYFDVPMAIKNTVRFESVNDYRVPTSHLMFGTSIRLIKVTVSFYYLYSQLEYISSTPYPIWCSAPLSI